MALLSSPADVNQEIWGNLSSNSKRRRRTSPEALSALEKTYAANPLPDKATRNHVCEQIGWDPRAVQVWFQNRRQREKREKETEAYYSRAARNSAEKENDNTTLFLVQQPSSAGPARSSPLLRSVPKPSAAQLTASLMGPPGPALVNSAFTPAHEGPGPLSTANEVWRLMVSSPERGAHAPSSSPVKAGGPMPCLKRTVSLDMMASRQQKAFGHLADGESSPPDSSAPGSTSRSSEVPSLSYSMAGESSDAETEELLTPDTTTFVDIPAPTDKATAVALDAKDCEAANLLLQLYAASA